jgi:hypothetical protein
LDVFVLYFILFISRETESSIINVFMCLSDKFVYLSQIQTKRYLEKSLTKQLKLKKGSFAFARDARVFIVYLICKKSYFKLEELIVSRRSVELQKSFETI